MKEYRCPVCNAVDKRVTEEKEEREARLLELSCRMRDLKNMLENLRRVVDYKEQEEK